MRTPDDVKDAQAQYYQNLAATELSSLPEGYLEGGELTITLGDVLVKPLIANVQGKQVTRPNATNISDMNWITPKINSTTFYIYIDRYGFFFVDTVADVVISDRYGTYNPRTQTRFVGKIYVNEVGFYVTTEIIGIQIIGYSGDGSNAEPKESDRRVYIDDDEISFEEFTGGDWSTVNSIKLGGSDSGGLFYPFLQCRGVLNPLADEISQEFFPADNFNVYNFEDTVNNQHGVDDWDFTGGIAYTTTHKFGSKALTTSSTIGSLIKPNTYANAGESQTAATWVYPTQLDDTSTETIYGYASTGLEDRISLILRETSIELRVTKDSTLTQRTISHTLTLNTWQYLSLVYDENTDTVSVIIDTTVYEESSFGGTWGSRTMFFSALVFNDKNIYFIDELLSAPDIYIDPDIFIQHYNHNKAWNTNASTKDVILSPATGGTTRPLTGVTVPVMHVQDQKANNTAGGTFTSGAWQTRVLNTAVTNTITGASLASNQITLPAGTYKVTASAPAFIVDTHKIKLYNITDTSDEIIGTSEYTDIAGGSHTRSFVTGTFTIAGEKDFEIQHRCTTTRGTNGFGLASNFSTVETYTDVFIEKIA